jgi:hypothetical protein
MDINLLIPDNDDNWISKHGILYYKKFVLIPLANWINGDLFINLDRRCVKAVIRLLNHCQKMNIPHLFCDSRTIIEKFIPNEHLDIIFFNNLMIIEEPKIFELIKNNRINYVNTLCEFIRLYNCQSKFSKIYHELNRDVFKSSWFDWYDKKVHHRIKNLEIRDYYETLFREIKISLLLSED